MARTTLDLDNWLFKKLKKQAADEGKPFKAVVNEILTIGLGVSGRMPASLKDFEWPEHSMGIPPIDPADRAALFDFLDKSP